MLSLFVGQRLRGLTATVKENLRTLTELIDAGQVTPIGRTAAEAADAIRYRGGSSGKVVIAV